MGWKDGITLSVQEVITTPSVISETGLERIGSINEREAAQSCWNSSGE